VNVAADIDRYPIQPAGEVFTGSELLQMPVDSKEHFLSCVARVFAISENAPGDCDYLMLVAGQDMLERIRVTLLGALNYAGKGSLFDRVFIQTRKFCHEPDSGDLTLHFPQSSLPHTYLPSLSRKR
jgi:hypothetical protein